MAETGQNVIVYAGNNVSLSLTLVDSAGDALNLSGVTLEWGLAKQAGADATLVKTSADDDEIEITDAAGGLATVYILPIDMVALVGRSHQHELRIIDSDGNKETLMVGIFTVKPSILD